MFSGLGYDQGPRGETPGATCMWDSPLFVLPSSSSSKAFYLKTHLAQKPTYWLSDWERTAHRNWAEPAFKASGFKAGAYQLPGQLHSLNESNSPETNHRHTHIHTQQLHKTVQTNVGDKGVKNHFTKCRNVLIDWHAVKFWECNSLSVDKSKLLSRQTHEHQLVSEGAAQFQVLKSPVIPDSCRPPPALWMPSWCPHLQHTCSPFPSLLPKHITHHSQTNRSSLLWMCKTMTLLKWRLNHRSKIILNHIMKQKHVEASAMGPRRIHFMIAAL